MKKQVNRKHFDVIYDSKAMFISMSKALQDKLEVIVRVTRNIPGQNLIGIYKDIPMYCHSHFYFGEARESIYIPGESGNDKANIRCNDLREVKKIIKIASEYYYKVVLNHEIQNI